MADQQPVKAPRCDEHPPMAALYRCDYCRKFMCKLCIRQGGGHDVCATCGKPCRVPSPDELRFALGRQTGSYRRASGADVFAPPRAGGVVAAPFVPPPPPPPPPPAAAAAPATQANAPAESQPPQPPQPFSERLPPYYCKNHPRTKATRGCSRCREYYCDACAKVVEDNPLCPECHAQIAALPPEEQGLPPRTLGTQVVEAFVFPFKGSGKLMLLLGVLFCWFLGFGGWRGSLLAVAFMYAYFAKVCRAAACGRETPPDWPGPGDFGVAFHFAVTRLLSMAPVILYVLFVAGPGILSCLRPPDVEQAKAKDEEREARLRRAEEHEVRRLRALEREEGASMTPIAADDIANGDVAMGPVVDAGDGESTSHRTEMDAIRKRLAAMRAAEDTGDPGIGRSAPVEQDVATVVLHLIVCFVLYLAGAIYLPMALLAIVLYRNWAVLSPGFVFSAIGRVPRDYILANVILIIADLAGFFGNAWGGAIPIFGGLISASLWLFLMMCQMFVLGRLYHFNQKRLDWFSATGAASS